MESTSHTVSMVPQENTEVLHLKHTIFSLFEALNIPIFLKFENRQAVLTVILFGDVLVSPQEPERGASETSTFVPIPLSSSTHRSKGTDLDSASHTRPPEALVPKKYC